jgi:hypothetical protein
MNFVNQWQKMLETAGLNEKMLLGFIAASFILSVLTSREFLAWYLKINQLKKETRQLNETVSLLKEEIHALRESKSSDKPVFSEPAQTKQNRRFSMLKAENGQDADML